MSRSSPDSWAKQSLSKFATRACDYCHFVTPKISFDLSRNTAVTTPPEGRLVRFFLPRPPSPRYVPKQQRFLARTEIHIFPAPVLRNSRRSHPARSPRSQPYGAALCRRPPLFLRVAGFDEKLCGDEAVHNGGSSKRANNTRGTLITLAAELLLDQRTFGTRLVKKDETIRTDGAHG